MSESYWGKPVPGFGDPKARLMVVGLAPAAHGANRTGRMFTGDRSGDWLYRALHKSGFANQPTSTHAEDGLALKDCWVTSVVKCAPPDNKPAPKEIEACSMHLQAELDALTHVKVFVALGQIALQGLWPHILAQAPNKARPKFAHGRLLPLADGRSLILSYHPSQQNTFTGRLTETMLDSVFNQAASRLKTGA